ncbi:MAG TPA: hypothetical protein VFK20_17055 [Vicinamibacterales bacterium]|nr:hypothetical protein [Vicinamibacterales bacterium]
MTKRLLMLALCVASCGGLLTSAASPRFFPDDPIRRAPETQDASGVQPSEISLAYDSLINLFGHPGTREVVRAQDLNSIGDVPDSSWFTNRLGAGTMTPDEVARGVNDDTGPARGPWTIRSGKGNGVSPGFTILDSRGERYFVKFDPPGWNELATGAEVVVTRLYHALGYNVPQTNIAYLSPEDLRLASNATTTGLDGKPRRMRQKDIQSNLDRAARLPDGRYRVIVSQALPGQPLGGFKYVGTRPDDPNDVVLHENRRVLRALRVFGAWVNHTDAKAINSLDTLVAVDGRELVRHHLLDFGSTLGSAGIGPRDRRDGYEYLVDVSAAMHALPAFGFAPRAWMFYRYPDYRLIGRFEGTHFDPEAWRPRVPNPAFLRARPDDLFWGARLVMRFTDDLIRAAVSAGHYSDPRTGEALTKALIERRDLIGRAWLTGVNPIDHPAIEDGMLTFENPAVTYDFAKAPASYTAVWSRFDNATGETTRIGETSGATSMAVPRDLPAADGSFVQVDIRADGGPHPSWAQPVHAWFRRAGGRWTLVGFQRLP